MELLESDSARPRQARYQAALRPDIQCCSDSKVLSNFCALRRPALPQHAAHIHSPSGGQGMNTGLHDVWNLVWKLDLSLHGRGNEQLLESYSTERPPVIKNVIETTDFLTKVMGTPNKFAQALRDTVIPHGVAPGPGPARLRAEAF
jgi:2-polyprenyl-6-methoxyphenol hydroxylase-like FAD-dependent oxidoreductase